CAAIFQDFVRYPWPARDNVAMATTANQLLLEQAAARAGAMGLIDGLPAGWDTVLSRQFDTAHLPSGAVRVPQVGVDLSGGEWQRVALARALYAADTGAGVLILDEPTAQLDARQEADFYGQFLN